MVFFTHKDKQNVVLSSQKGAGVKKVSNSNHLMFCSVGVKAVNRGDKRSRRYRYRDFAKFERSRRYRDRYRCQEKKSGRGRDRYLVFRDPPPAENESLIANR